MARVSVRDLDVRGKRVLVRVDFNVPTEVRGGKVRVTDDTRIRESLPTINYLREHGAKTILMSHFGRPKGKPAEKYSLRPIGEVIPALKGKLNGGAFRVPTPDGSVTDFTAVLEKDATVDTINAAFKEAASDKSYKGVLEFSNEPLVSQDIVGNPHSCIFDSKLTLTIGNRFVKVVGWYDNEWGYSNRCAELMEMLAE